MAKLNKGQKSKIMKAVMQAHVAGIQKGRMAGAQPPAGGPPMPPPGAGAPPPMGMKAGGKVASKEKWTPPWAKKACGGKVKKMASGGVVRGGRGDGCATRGHTRGKMC